MAHNKKEYYRNTQDLYINNHQTIDQGALWVKTVNDKLILEDDDDFVEHELDPNLFKKI